MRVHRFRSPIDPLTLVRYGRFTVPPKVSVFAPQTAAAPRIWDRLKPPPSSRTPSLDAPTPPDISSWWPAKPPAPVLRPVAAPVPTTSTTPATVAVEPETTAATRRVPTLLGTTS